MDAGLTLSTEMLLVLGLIAFTVLMFAFELVRADVVALLLLVVLGITNLVPAEQLFSGFAGDAVVAILATMILGAGLDRTGVLNFAASFLVRISQGVERRLLISLCALSGMISAFMQNPAVAALFLPVAARISSRTGVPMSRMLLPMACCIVLGGTMTMVGNSPQIMLNDLVASMNRNLPPGADTIEPFHMFSVLPVGATLLVAGLAYFAIWWDKLLPPREERASVTPAKTETYFAATYRIAGEVCELAVTPDSPLVGLSIAELEAQASTPLVLAIKTGEESRLAPPGDQMIWVGTVLGVLAPREDAAAWAEITGLRLLPGLRNFGDMFNPSRAGIAEAVVPPNSRYIGKRIGELKIRKNYGVSVLAVNRGDKIFREDVREVVIQQGDTLVFHGFWKDLGTAAGERDFVVVTDYPKEEQRPHKIWHATIFFALAIGLALFSDVKVPVAMLAGAIGMLLTGVLSMDEAYAAIGWRTIFLMACLIPLGWAVDSSGAAAWVARETLVLLDGVPIWGLEVALALLTSFFTQVMSNVGATVVMVPLAINIALAANASAEVFAMIVVFSASNAFVSMSNPVMSLVSGAGGYRTADLLRVGLPLTLLYTAIVVGMVNVVF